MERAERSDGSLRIGGRIREDKRSRFGFMRCCMPRKEAAEEEDDVPVAGFETPFMPAVNDATVDNVVVNPKFGLTLGGPAMLQSEEPASTPGKRPSEVEELRVRANNFLSFLPFFSPLCLHLVEAATLRMGSQCWR